MDKVHSPKGKTSLYLLNTSLIVVLHRPDRLHDFSKLGHTTTCSIHLTKLREGMEVLSHISHNGTLIGLGDITNILDIQQLGNVEMVGCNIKGELSICVSVRLVERVKVQKVRAVAVNQSTAREGYNTILLAE